MAVTKYEGKSPNFMAYVWDKGKKEISEKYVFLHVLPCPETEQGFVPVTKRQRKIGVALETATFDSRKPAFPHPLVIVT